MKYVKDIKITVKFMVKKIQKNIIAKVYLFQMEMTSMKIKLIKMKIVIIIPMTI